MSIETTIVSALRVPWAKVRQTVNQKKINIHPIPIVRDNHQSSLSYCDLGERQTCTRAVALPRGLPTIWVLSTSPSTHCYQWIHWSCDGVDLVFICLVKSPPNLDQTHKGIFIVDANSIRPTKTKKPSEPSRMGLGLRLHPSSLYLLRRQDPGRALVPAPMMIAEFYG